MSAKLKGPSDARKTLLSTSKLSCRLGERELLAPTSLSLTPGLTALVGPNGSGKSTLLRALAGLIAKPVLVTGEVSYADKPSCAWLAQEIQANVTGFETSQLSVEALIQLAFLASQSWMSRPKKSELARAQHFIETFDLSTLKTQALHQISGGELQRAQLARVFAMDRSVLLLDEPSNHLDLKHLQMLERLMLEQKQLGHGVLYSTHDLNFALKADRLLLMLEGRIGADISLRSLAEASPVNPSEKTCASLNRVIESDQDIAEKLSACFGCELQIIRCNGQIISMRAK